MTLPTRVRPANEVHVLSANDGVYDLLTITAPRLTGFLLRLFVWIAESWICAPIRAKLLRDNKFPQTLRETVYPEAPTTSPVLCGFGSRTFPVNEIQFDDPAARANKATELLQDGSKTVTTHSELPSRHWTASQFRRAYTEGITTPSEVAERIIRCIAEWDGSEPKMNWFIAHDVENVRQQAAEATKRYQERRPLSTLDGVPYAVKDMMHALPYKTTCGTTYMASMCKAEKDHPMVVAMRATGAVLLGKTNLHELGVSPIGINMHYGIIRNPHNPDHFAGGSSSGSAAVVAAGLCPFAIGNDGGGSIRVPAACCGVVGLKPTWGRDCGEGSPNLVKTLVSTGPIAASVADALLMYAVIANAGQTGIGASVAPACIPQSLPDPSVTQDPLHGKKLGVYWDWFTDAAPDVVDTCKATLNEMCKSGAEIVPITIPELDACRVAHIYTFGSEAACAHTEELQTPALRHQLASDVRITLALASTFTAQQFLQAQRIRTRMMTYMQKVFAAVDFVVTPTMPQGAPIIRPDVLTGGESDLSTVGWMMRFVALCNFTGYPAVSVPAGHTSQGLPVGIQLIGRPWDEAGLLYAAQVIEDARKEHMRFPMISVDLMKG